MNRRQEQKPMVGWLTVVGVLLALGDFTPAMVAGMFVVWLVVVFCWNLWSRQADSPRGQRIKQNDPQL